MTDFPRTWTTGTGAEDEEEVEEEEEEEILTSSLSYINDNGTLPSGYGKDQAPPSQSHDGDSSAAAPTSILGMKRRLDDLQSNTVQMTSIPGKFPQGDGGATPDGRKKQKPMEATGRMSLAPAAPATAIVTGTAREKNPVFSRGDGQVAVPGGGDIVDTPFGPVSCTPAERYQE